VKSGRPAVRARAALKLARRFPELAFDALAAVLPAAVDEVCSLVDALGIAGDARAVPLVREYAERKLLSRRRSAVEALRRLGDRGSSAAPPRVSCGGWPGGT